MPVKTGDIVGERYRLLKLIGHGGMGEVWRAQDATLDRPVAIKILVDESVREKDAEAFLHEARMAAAVRHRNVVEVLDFGRHVDRAPYIVMELLEGETLGDVFYRQGRLTFDEILTIAIDALNGLAAAHDAGIVHRDLKPENIFLTRDRDSLYAKLLDFGISKSLDAQRPSPVVTQEGRVVGTPAYMSPEQARGLRDIDHRTDLYSMGVILFEALSGEPPFFEDNPGDLMVKIITAPTPRLDAAVPELGKPLADFIERAMHRVPELRFQTADEMRRDLEYLARNRISEEAVKTVSERPRTTSWRHSESLRAAAVAAQPDSPAQGASASEASGTPGGSRGTLLIVGAACLLLAAAGLVWSRVRDQQAPKPYVIKVQPAAAEQPSAPHSGGQPESAPNDSLTPPDTAATDPGPSIAPAPTRPQRTHARKSPRKPKLASAVDGDALSARFQAQQRGVVRCLQAGADQISNEAAMAIRFEIDRAGRVTRATVLPEQLAATSTGRCMRKAAESMRFGDQAAPLTFRIPLRAKSAG